MAKRTQNQQTAELIEAVRFAALAQTNTAGASEEQTHCLIKNRLISASNGLLSASTKIAIEFEAFPHTEKLLKALESCGDDLSITKPDDTKIVIKSGSFRATIPCLPVGIVPDVFFDRPIAVIGDILKTALKTCAGLASNSATTVVQSSVLLANMSAFATNNIVMVEAWHGCNLPPGLVIPKQSIQAMCKPDSPWVKFGFSENSLTIFYENGAWIKTQLYAVEWPDVNGLFNKYPVSQFKPDKVPTGLADAVSLVLPFAQNNHITIEPGLVKSAGADCEVPELQGLKTNINGEYLLYVLNDLKANLIDIGDRKMMLYFSGEGLRGFVAKMSPNGD